MKNIHVLPTDKPSSLFITEGRLFNYHKPQQGDGVKIINQNIYITNSEEIKQGDYGLVVNEILSYNKMIELWGLTQGWKIILTDNKDLIKDGVQVIDDEFLEWFVNNPSCERIEVNGISDVALGGFADVCYKIIIPRTTQQIINEDYAGGLEMGQIIPKEEPKQETLEEAAERYAVKKSSSDVFRKAHREDFINGAKWQQERMYSEEDMKEAFKNGAFKWRMHSAGKCFEEWFEQFKNK